MLVKMNRYCHSLQLSFLFMQPYSFCLRDKILPQSQILEKQPIVLCILLKKIWSSHLYRMISELLSSRSSCCRTGQALLLYGLLVIMQRLDTPSPVYSC